MYQTSSSIKEVKRNLTLLIDKRQIKKYFELNIMVPEDLRLSFNTYAKILIIQQFSNSKNENFQRDPFTYSIEQL